jgi:Mce-associated membrane protein
MTTSSTRSDLADRAASGGSEPPEDDTGHDDPAVGAESDLDDDSGARAEEPEPPDGEANDNPDVAGGGRRGNRRRRWAKMLTIWIMALLCVALAVGAGYLRWQYVSRMSDERAQSESMQAARDATEAMLSYNPDSAERDLGAAAARLTSSFKDSYTALVHDVVIPGAKQKAITAVAKVAAIAPVRLSGDHAVILVFVDQTITIGSAPPTDTTSSVRITLENIGGHWLVSGFDPV